MGTPRAPRRRFRFYETAAGARPAQDFLSGLPTPARDAVLAALGAVEAAGLRAARHLRGALDEVRAAHAGRQFRVLFAPEAWGGHILLALDAFSKQTQRTPPRLLDLAEARLRDWRARGAAGGRPRPP